MITFETLLFLTDKMSPSLATQEQPGSSLPQLSEEVNWGSGNAERRQKAEQRKGLAGWEERKQPVGYHRETEQLVS